MNGLAPGHRRTVVRCLLLAADLEGPGLSRERLIDLALQFGANPAVTRDDVVAVLNAPVSQALLPLPQPVPERPVPLAESVPWQTVYDVVSGYADKLKTVLLVEDGRVREAIEALGRSFTGEVWSTVESGDSAIPSFRQRDSARVFVLPFRRYHRGVDLSFASVGVIAVSKTTAESDEVRLRQAIGRFDRLGGATREIRVFVVEDT